MFRIAALAASLAIVGCASNSDGSATLGVKGSPF